MSYAQAPKATALFLDYLYRFDRVRRFYEASPFDLAGYQEVAREVAAQHRDRDSLVEILTRQNQGLFCSESTLTNLRRLRQPGTLAVVTGQQVGLFSGPAFTLYKALTAVRLSQQLTSWGLDCIPVFWLATEDHDLEEVATAAVLDDAGELVELSDPGDRPAPHCSVGYVALSPQITLTLNRLEQVLPPGEPRDKLLSDLRECYLPGSRWGEAFGRLMARLFSRFGVVMIDPLNEEIHQAARGGYAQVLHEASSFRRLLQTRSKELEDSGYHAQVRVGDDSTLLFASRNGNRAAIRQRDSNFYLEGENGRAAEDLEAWIARRPLDFSPSALLRPIIQDTVLPTVAYVAGPAELAYLGQAQVLYRQFGRPMPVLFPRTGFTLANQKIGRLLEKYQITLEDVWQGEEHVRRRIATAGLARDGDRAWPDKSEAGDDSRPPRQLEDPARSENALARATNAVPSIADADSWAARLGQTETTLKQLLRHLRDDVEAIDPTLIEAVRHSEEKMMYQLDRLKGKISRAAVQRSEVMRRHEQELIRFLVPAGNLQEREISGIYFLAHAGYELLDRLLSEIPTTRAEHRLFIY